MPPSCDHPSVRSDHAPRHEDLALHLGVFRLAATCIGSFIHGSAGVRSAMRRKSRIASSPWRRTLQSERMLTVTVPAQISCALETLPQTTCSLGNETCLCHDKTFMELVGGCTFKECSVKDALGIANLTWAACKFPVTDQTQTTQYALGFLFALAFVFMGLRVLSRALTPSLWGAEDTTITLAFLFLIAETCLSYLLVNVGVGRDIWTLQPDSLTDFFKLLFITQILYMVVMTLIKSSILFFYLRIFTVGRIQIVIWCTQAFNILLGTAYVLASLFQCQPIQAYWTAWDGEHTGRCSDFRAVVLSHIAVNIGLDVWMLVLPLTQLVGLRLEMRKKIGVMAMFSCGIFLTIVSAIRIWSFIVQSMNITVASTWGLIWSYVELCVGVAVACMPAARQVSRKLFPKISGSTRKLLSRTSKYDRSSNTRELQLVTPSQGPSQLEASLSNDPQSALSTPLKPYTPSSAAFSIDESHQ
ncbi:Satratoxin biosynthesis SC1 cluster protein 4 [Colletotrichum trifolii]|uniref:Satratoxin biosynthesis SC1 cluster protein 4 n=1 Tax=Colletotrichum trifolii TaxID=5466 RepID=A0A4V3HVG2_COLTR|nr:Satratoxin biosynthesis SC1 cluster protein 4 [Colletotrichum trifolii]